MTTMDNQVQVRSDFANSLARKAGVFGARYFASISDLAIERKGAQDLVSNADRDVETFIRTALAQAFPQDGIVGEEYGNAPGTSGFTWVIDPIDGTANFVSGIPQWCTILACVRDDRTQIAAIYEPGADELYTAVRGRGALLNGKPIRVAATDGLNDGSLGVGMNGRTEVGAIVRFIGDLAMRGGIFFRNASGGLMLSYVAAGRLIGYAEPHMNAWDCLAGQLLIEEAGGCVETQSAQAMLERGGRVVASAPAIFDELVNMADRAFG